MAPRAALPPLLLLLLQALTASAQYPWDSRNISAAEWVCDASASQGVSLAFVGGATAACGNEVLQDATTFSGAPLVWWSAARETDTYTVIIVDRDARSAAEPLVAPIRHFATSYVPGATLLAGYNTSFGVWTSYSGPQPPAGTGCHRYYVQLYRETPGAAIANASAMARTNWDFATWAINSSLTKLSVNMFTTQSLAARTGGCAATSGASRTETLALAWAGLATLLAVAAAVGSFVV